MEENEPDWRLREWMQHFGKRQASLVNELGWPKGRAHAVWHSRVPYRRDLINLLSRWLGIRPYELLMSPDEALALRRLRQAAATIAAEDPAHFERGPPDPRFDGGRAPERKRAVG